MKRTHTCNALRPADAGQTVTLVGWVDTKSDLGGVTFVDLRDREGMTQVVFNPGANGIQEIAQRLKTESVIEITGKVRARSADTVNAKLATGSIEISAGTLVVHNVCADLPFPMDDDKADKVNEDLRLEYRFLDLRRPRNIGLLKLRAKAAAPSAPNSTARTSSRSRPRPSSRAPRKAPASSSCRAAPTPANSTRSRSPRSSTSRC